MMPAFFAVSGAVFGAMAGSLVGGRWTPGLAAAAFVGCGVWGWLVDRGQRPGA